MWLTRLVRAPSCSWPLGPASCPSVGRRKAGVQRASELRDATPSEVVNELGNGSLVIATDTVPHALWCASRCIDSYEEAFWLAASALGDIDTNCAIVGGIVASYVGKDGIPESWRNAVEKLGSTFDWDAI